MQHSSNIIRDRIEKIAEERRIPIKRLSREAGLSERTLGHFLDGRNSSLTVTSLLAIADYLSVPAAWLLGQDDVSLSPVPKNEQTQVP
jgi:transcriptional regulator with XRE-family HTH domain